MCYYISHTCFSLSFNTVSDNTFELWEETQFPELDLIERNQAALGVCQSGAPSEAKRGNGRIKGSEPQMSSSLLLIYCYTA